MSTTEKRTLVEEGTEFKGTLSSKCPIDVVGKVEGDISGPSIHVAATGTIAGIVKVKDLHSEGELAGEVDAETVHLSGRVRSNTVIRASSLEVQLSRSEGKMEVMFGECQIEVGAEPNKEAAIAAALASPVAAATPVAAAPPEPEMTIVAAPAAVESRAPAKTAVTDDDWDVSDEKAEAAPAEGDEESTGKTQSKRERRRRSTIPPPPG
jgi:cytoskeletal protein CcmA (bactofilin family)